MKQLRQILLVAAFSALGAGLLLALVQQFQVVPIIAQAEVYEQAAHGHHDGEATTEWAPADGLERNLYTAAADIVVAMGFALLLMAITTSRGQRLDIRQGLLWGLAGYAVFFIAPSLGLPPEVPGTEAAALADRQGWWLLAVTASAAGLALIVFPASWLARIAGIMLLALPHLIGAPAPEMAGAVAPQELAHRFITASAFCNAVFWLALGGLLGFFSQRWQDNPLHV